jgi:hypothetical protein
LFGLWPVVLLVVLTAMASGTRVVKPSLAQRYR